MRLTDPSWGEMDSLTEQPHPTPRGPWCWLHLTVSHLVTSSTWWPPTLNPHSGSTDPLSIIGQGRHLGTQGLGKPACQAGPWDCMDTYNLPRGLNRSMGEGKWSCAHQPLLRTPKVILLKVVYETRLFKQCYWPHSLHKNETKHIKSTGNLAQ